jgi:hypothetical protein
MRSHMPVCACCSHVPLRKPELRNDAQLRLDRAKVLRTIADDHNSLLHRAPCHLWRAVDQLACIELSCTRYAEERRRGVGRSMRAAERKIRVVFCGGMRTVAQGHEGQEGPVVVCRWIRPFFCTEPGLDFGASVYQY